MNKGQEDAQCLHQCISKSAALYLLTVFLNTTPPDLLTHRLLHGPSRGRIKTTLLLHTRIRQVDPLAPPSHNARS